MLTAILTVASLSLTILAYIVKRATIGIGAAFAWLVLSLHCYDQSTVAWDIYYSLFWFGIAMTLGVLIEAVGMKVWAYFSGNSGESEKETKTKKAEPTQTVYMHPADRLRAKHGLPPSAARARRDNNKEFYR
jgi:hypothetical protein